MSSSTTALEISNQEKTPASSSSQSPSQSSTGSGSSTPSSDVTSQCGATATKSPTKQDKVTEEGVETLLDGEGHTEPNGRTLDSSTDIESSLISYYFPLLGEAKSFIDDTSDIVDWTIQPMIPCSNSSRIMQL